MTTARRSELLAVRLTPAELDLCRKAAALDDRSLSSWARRVLLEPLLGDTHSVAADVLAGKRPSQVVPVPR